MSEKNTGMHDCFCSMYKPTWAYILVFFILTPHLDWCVADKNDCDKNCVADKNDSARTFRRDGNAGDAPSVKMEIKLVRGRSTVDLP